MRSQVYLPRVTAYRNGVTNLYKANARAKYPAEESFIGDNNFSLIPIDCSKLITSTPLKQIILISIFIINK